MILPEREVKRLSLLPDPSSPVNEPFDENSICCLTLSVDVIVIAERCWNNGHGAVKSLAHVYFFNLLISL